MINLLIPREWGEVKIMHCMRKQKGRNTILSTMDWVVQYRENPARCSKRLETCVFSNGIWGQPVHSCGRLRTSLVTKNSPWKMRVWIVFKILRSNVLPRRKSRVRLAFLMRTQTSDRFRSCGHCSMNLCSSRNRASQNGLLRLPDGNRLWEAKMS